MNNLDKLKQSLWLALPAIVGILIALAMRWWSPISSPLTLTLPWTMLPVAIGVLLSTFALTGYILARQSQHRSDNRLQQLRTEQSQDRQRFMQRLDHEFKNPLTVIRAGITSLQATSQPHADTPQSDEPQTVLATGSSETQTVLETVSKQTMRLVRLTSDLRKIAEIESRPLDFADVDLDALLTEVVDLLLEHDAEREILLSLPRAPWPLPSISGDWDLLFLAFYNLGDNARKFSQPNDTLEIRAREEDNRIIVEVADTGMGITAEELPHVWDELYRGENGQAISGSGLGLPLVRAIIERHNGTIALTSRPTEGTNVTVQLHKEPQTDHA